MLGRGRTGHPVAGTAVPGRMRGGSEREPGAHGAEQLVQSGGGGVGRRRPGPLTIPLLPPGRPPAAGFHRAPSAHCRAWCDTAFDVPLRRNARRPPLLPRVVLGTAVPRPAGRSRGCRTVDARGSRYGVMAARRLRLGGPAGTMRCASPGPYGPADPGGPRGRNRKDKGARAPRMTGGGASPVTLPAPGPHTASAGAPSTTGSAPSARPSADPRRGETLVG